MPAVLHVCISMVSMSFSQTNASTAGFCRQIRKWRVWCCTNLHVWVNRVSETWKNSEIGGLQTWCSICFVATPKTSIDPLRTSASVQCCFCASDFLHCSVSISEVPFIAAYPAPTILSDIATICFNWPEHVLSQCKSWAFFQLIHYVQYPLARSRG